MSKKTWITPSVKSTLSIKATLGDTGPGNDSMMQAGGSTDNNPNNPNKVIS